MPAPESVTLIRTTLTEGNTCILESASDENNLRAKPSFVPAKKLLGPSDGGLLSVPADWNWNQPLVGQYDGFDAAVRN